jgi:hypothetical protein
MSGENNHSQEKSKIPAPNIGPAPNRDAGLVSFHAPQKPSIWSIITDEPLPFIGE